MKTCKTRSSGKVWKRFCPKPSPISGLGIRIKSNGPWIIPNGGWPSSSAGIWDSPHAGRTMAKLKGKRTTKSGADLPWEPSMPGSKVPSSKSPQTAGLWTLAKTWCRERHIFSVFNNWKRRASISLPPYSISPRFLPPDPEKPLPTQEPSVSTLWFN